MAKEFVGRNLSFAMSDKTEFDRTIQNHFGMKSEDVTVVVGITVGRRKDERPVAKFLMRSEFR